MLSQNVIFGGFFEGEVRMWWFSACFLKLTGKRGTPTEKYVKLLKCISHYLHIYKMELIVSERLSISSLSQVKFLTDLQLINTVSRQRAL